MFITDGAGFIGGHATVYFASLAWKVSVLDNLSRAGAEKSLDWKAKVKLNDGLLELIGWIRANESLFHTK